jgi:hypothetical protein
VGSVFRPDDPWLDFCGDNILVCSTGRGGVCCPKFFATAKQASYVGKQNLVWCSDLNLGFGCVMTYSASA